ncbi:GFA family protein [Pseudoruegeria sp. HB172150]|uniref:GFA family protein n=1 Tax=Pseudoruegeria sp. HB172150 TaxID=2721164 RepID=UPI0015566AD4|nr:GFA family protein [Pseudoruegeria sp. HB172150]
MDGKCTCGKIRYRLAARPLFVHCCHCRWCQRETGSAFVLNALIEASKVEVLECEPMAVATPSESGNGQIIHRCPDCHVALWSIYSGAGDRFLFVRVGTLLDPDACPPDIHIFTESKQPWVVLPEGVPAMPEYYRRSQYWPDWALERREAALAE